MATTTTTSVHTYKESPLRRRMRMLDRAHSDSVSSVDTLVSGEVKALPLSDKLKQQESEDEMPSPPLTDYENGSESSEDERSSRQEKQPQGPTLSAQSPVRPQRPAVNTENLPHHKDRGQTSPMSPNSRAWYEFDLAVVVALVSPIGNWLTGTDHIKNLLLIVLLIFYLHQIIEIPWTMYQKSRPRKRPTHLASDASPESRYTELAASELQKFEMFFLFLTFASPIIGAIFLRYSTAAVLGPDAVSWFSTGLFVLATGMRPWAHFVERVTQRTAELHDFVHYPPPLHGVSTEAHEALEKRIVLLEKALDKMKSKVSHTTEDVYEYVDDAVDAVEHAMRKQERKWDRYEGKVKAVEQTVVELSGKTAKASIIPDKNIRGALTADIYTLKAYLRSVVNHTMPTWLTSRLPEYAKVASSKSPSSSYLLSTPRQSGRSISGRSVSSQSSLSPSQSATPLETIFEEGPVSREKPLLTEPYHLASAFVFRVGYLATMPVRAIARMVLRRY